MSEIILTKTDKRALDLINAGKVHIQWGQRFALAEGSKGQVYKVSKDSCDCEASRRYPGPCKHQRSLQALCGLIRLARAEAAQTGRTRLPAVVGRALLPFPVVASTLVPLHVPRDRRGVPYCSTCGADLVGGMCPGHRARRLESDLFGPEAA